MINMFSLQNQVWGITFCIFFPVRLSSLLKNFPFHPQFVQDLHEEVLGCGCRGPTASTEHVGCERVEIIIIIIIIRMGKGLYPLRGVSKGGRWWWWWCSVSCWVVPTRGGPTTDVGEDLLGQPWQGRDFSRPFLGRNNLLPWPAGISLQYRVSSGSTAWAGGEWDLEEKLELGLLLDAVGEELHGALWAGQWQQLITPLPWFLGKSKWKLGWPELVLTETSIKFPWLSRLVVRYFWGQHLQESKIRKGTQLLWSRRLLS